MLRAKIDMAAPNINLRDPAIYRVRHAEHHNTGNQWCIYPMYTFAHPIEDALEHITHSICTLEFEDQRPFYDWLLDHLRAGGLIVAPQPRQYEFARLNLTYVVTSKRKLKHLVDSGTLSGWDDPRMPTIVGLRRRGYTPASIRNFCERIGVTKDYSWIDYATLDGCLREDLENQAHRAMVVLDPVKLELTNWAEVFGTADHLEACSLPALPHVAEGEVAPERHFTLGREVWIEREDFAEVPPKGYKRLFPGNKVRLKGGYVIECTGAEKDADGNITKVLATVVPDTKSDSWIDYGTLEGCLREDLEAKAHRGMAVINPVKLVLTNWDEVMGAGHLEPCSLPALPHAPHGASSGAAPEGQSAPAPHQFSIGKEAWIEREDFAEVPPKGYKRLYPPRPGADGQMLPGNKVRLKGGYVIECTGCTKDAAGNITEVLATVVPDTKSGTPGADSVKVKAAITWVGVADGVSAEVRMYDRLFLDAQPDAGGKDFLQCLNPNSLKVVTAIVEPSLANAQPDDKFQFERHGYFVADRIDHQAGKPVFNLAVGLKDSWGK